MSSMPAQNFDLLFKVLAVGDSGCGKTCLSTRIADDTFSSSYASTIGVDFKILRRNRRGTSIKMQLWDTAGQERFRTITAAYYRGATGIILCFDLTVVSTFENAGRWLEEIQRQASPTVSVVLVGCKADLAVEGREVPRERAEEFAARHDMTYFEVSAKTGVNCEAAVDALLDKMLTRAPSTTFPGRTTVSVTHEGDRASGCCGGGGGGGGSGHRSSSGPRTSAASSGFDWFGWFDKPPSSSVASAAAVTTAPAPATTVVAAPPVNPNTAVLAGPGTPAAAPGEAPVAVAAPVPAPAPAPAPPTPAIVAVPAHVLIHPGDGGAPAAPAPGSVGPECGSGASTGSSVSTSADFEEFVVSSASVDPLPEVAFEDLVPTEHPVRSGGFKSVTQFLYQDTEVAVVMLKSAETDWGVEPELFSYLSDVRCVPRVFGTVEHDGRRGLVMEWLADGCLADYLTAKKAAGATVTMEWRLRVARQVADGMCALAKKRVIHRDLAARNILLANAGSVLMVEAKICDFGLSRVSDSYHRVLSAFPWRYAAPECLPDGRNCTTKSDVWAFGLLVWELFTDVAELPFRKFHTPASLRAALCSNDVDMGDLLPCPPTCPTPLWHKVVLPCLTPNPSFRPSWQALLREWPSSAECKRALAAPAAAAASAPSAEAGVGAGAGGAGLPASTLPPQPAAPALTV